MSPWALPGVLEAPNHLPASASWGGQEANQAAVASGGVGSLLGAHLDTPGQTQCIAGNFRYGPEMGRDLFVGLRHV